VFLLVVAIVFEMWRAGVPTDGTNYGVTPDLSPLLRNTRERPRVSHKEKSYQVSVNERARVCQVQDKE